MGIAKMPAVRTRTGLEGSSLLEILIGLLVLALAYASLLAYTTSQRNGLTIAGQLSDGTRVASTALESVKGMLADSIAFANIFSEAQFAPKVFSNRSIMNNQSYAITLTLNRAPAPLYALVVRAKVSWKSIHSFEMGVLIPGSTSTL